MKKIGLIDYYLDNWHAEHLPEWLKNVKDGEYVISYAWGSYPLDGKLEGFADRLPAADWCAKHNITLCDTPEEVIAQSDVLMVLCPNNPELHEELCKLPLASGKRVYIDKTFAPDVATAKRIFAMAEAGNSPMFSSSALRFTEELKDVCTDNISIINTRGGGVFEIYSIHQIEMIVKLMNAKALRVMALGVKEGPACVIEFEGGKYATMGLFPSAPFSLAINYKDGTDKVINECTNFFQNFVVELVDFYETGIPKAPKEQTIDVIGIRETALKAFATPGVWVDCDF